MISRASLVLGVIRLTCPCTAKASGKGETAQGNDKDDATTFIA